MSYLAVASIIGTMTQAYGQYAEAEQASEAMEYNSRVAEMDAQKVEKQKEFELHKLEGEKKRLLARQVATMAASGRSFSGSPLEVMARTEESFLTDASAIRYNATQSQARLYGEAAHQRGFGKAEKAIGTAKGFSTLSTGITKTASAQSKGTKRKSFGKGPSDAKTTS